MTQEEEFKDAVKRDVEVRVREGVKAVLEEVLHKEMTQHLKRRLPDTETLRREVLAWEAQRNRLGASVDWRFTTEDARVKLRILYPSIEL